MAKAVKMLHSSTGRVQFPVHSSRASTKCIRRGRFQVSAAIKKGKEKNVVCTKTIVSKKDTVRPMSLLYLHRIHSIFAPVHMVHAGSCRAPRCHSYMHLHGSVQVDTVERMCRDIMDFSHGKQKVKSSGIMEFGVSRDQFEPHVFYTWERYDSNGSLGRHNTCPEFQAFMENV